VASVLSESFEGSGYENSWTEAAGSGNTVDEDSTAVARPPGGGSQILEISLGGSAVQAYTYNLLSPVEDDIWIKFWWYLDSSSAESSDYDSILILQDDRPVTQLYALVYYSSGWLVTINGYDGVSLETLLGPVSVETDTWYQIWIRYNYTDQEEEARIYQGGTLVDSNIETGWTIQDNIFVVVLGCAFSNRTVALTQYIDRFEIDDADWPEIAPRVPPWILEGD